mmetsp:Transcript_53988/g.117740  ORF Transcript_53988/g.117740 Transcript_53988/m.117740 type:complete len:237 (-) Transcript_53988:361-1071(-)
MASDSLVHQSRHPLIRHKISQMRKAKCGPKYLNQLLKEVSTFLCYEATADLGLAECSVLTKLGEEKGEYLAARVAIVPVLRGGLGMLEAMTEMVSNAQVWHLGIYRDKKSLLPVEYYNKLPKRVTAHTVFVLDPLPISGATAVAAIDILKAWGASSENHKLTIKFICIGASEQAITNICTAHPDVPIHVGLIDRLKDEQGAPLPPVLPGMGDIGDRLFGTCPDEALPLDEADGQDM